MMKVIFASFHVPLGTAVTPIAVSRKARMRLWISTTGSIGNLVDKSYEDGLVERVYCRN